MADETGGGNPGPIGPHGIAVALIGAASAIMVGMINGKVWPFNGAEPAVVGPEVTGPGTTSFGPGPVGPGTSPVSGSTPETSGPPSPAQTARQFLEAADPEFEPATAINRKIYVHNRCAQAMTVRIVYEKLNKTIDGLGESYSAEPQELFLPKSDDGTGAATYRRYVFIHARTADDAIRWSGRYPLTTDQGVINFRAWKLEVDGDGDYRVTLDCDA